MKIKILHEDCSLDLATDKALPYTAYLVSYSVQVRENWETKYDIVIANKVVDIFDHYYDKYRDKFLDMQQCEGRVNPKLWSPPGSGSAKVTSSKK